MTPTEPLADDVADDKVRRVVEAGRERGIAVEPVTFPEETRTAADAARAVGCDVAQIVKSLVFTAGLSPILLLVSGANRVDVTVAASAAGVDGLTRADADLAKRATGFSIGATPPVGLANDLPVLMDEDLLRHDVVWAAAGRPDAVFAVEPSALARASGAKVCRLTS
ncbi:MAG TPA: YbaK/EbsC family protein [Actinomycetota bacterium]|jgi:prolyl-tRNA editing enzyme YbaK/EbsC (Cys-tRNA(Pro) deacylase)